MDTPPISLLASRKSRGKSTIGLLGLRGVDLKPIGYVDGYSSSSEIASQIVEAFNLHATLRQERAALMSAREGRDDVNVPDLPCGSPHVLIEQVFPPMYDIRPLSVRMPTDRARANIVLVGTYAGMPEPIAYIDGRLKDAEGVALDIADAVNGLAPLQAEVDELRDLLRDAAADGPGHP